MQYLELQLDDLVIDPTNYRGEPRGIDTLAKSIREHGLLQNMVVTPREDGRYLVMAGNRRLLALDRLMAEGHIPRDTKFMCLVRDDSPWESLTENLIREDVAPWQTGYRFLELNEAGHSSHEIGKILGISHATVFNYIRLSRGLHPKIIEKATRLGHKCLNKTQYMRLADCINRETLEPDLEVQLLLFERMLDYKDGVKKRRRTQGKKLSEVQELYRRFERLCDGSVALPPHVQTVVVPLLNYLNGDTKRPFFPPQPKVAVDGDR